jgi:hypothetical protein
MSARHPDQTRQRLHVVDWRPLPCDLDAEAACLSAVLYQGERVVELDELRPEHFYSDAHRRIFEAILELRDAGTPIDVGTVADSLDRADRLAQVGGREYLGVVASAAPVLIPAHLKARIAILQRHWRARQALTITRGLAERVEGGAEPDAAIDGALAGLAALRPLSPASTVLGADAIWAPRPPIAFVVDRLLPRGSLALICATGSSLKTWLALALVIAVATGEDWLDRFACEQGASLFVDWESGEDELRRRLQRLSACPVPGVSIACMPATFINAPDFEATSRQWATDRRLLVIDSLAAGTVDIDENDARFAQGLRTLKRVAEETGCVIVVLHHNRKGRAEGDDDERDRPRGTSAIYAACDVVLSLSRADDDAFMVHQTKARGGRKVEPFVVRVDDVGESRTVVSSREAQERTAARDSFGEAKGRVLRLLATDHDCRSANEIHRRVRGTKRTVLEAVKELEERGTIARVAGTYRLVSEVST